MKLSKKTAVIGGAVLGVTVILGGLAAAQSGSLNNDDDDDLRRTGSIEVNERSLPEDDREEQSALEEKATLDQSDAEAAALDSVGGGSISEVELDEESGFLVWDVEVQFEGSEHEVAVDAGDGRILGSEQEQADDDRGDNDGEDGDDD
jgi:uncharacterized membrane protein YkoI